MQEGKFAPKTGANLPLLKQGQICPSSSRQFKSLTKQKRADLPKARADLPLLFPPIKITNKTKRGRFARGQKQTHR
jgi:hypothetical protein